MAEKEEMLDSGIMAVFFPVNFTNLISLSESDDLQSKCEKGTIKKSVHKKHLACGEIMILKIE